MNIGIKILEKTDLIAEFRIDEELLKSIREKHSLVKNTYLIYPLTFAIGTVK
jgi:hypothetical protein